MSRSYKKIFIWKDNQRDCHKDKHRASRKLRRCKKMFQIPFGCYYKRFYEQWNIHDYIYSESSIDSLDKLKEVKWIKRKGWWKSYYK